MTDLTGARVLVVGVGGLGAPAALALAAAGVGTLGLVDDDPVELSNLHRQVLFGEADVGRPKVHAAASTLERMAPGVRCVLHEERLVPASARRLLEGYDLVVEGSDNFATKFLTADACLLEGKPVVQGAAVRWVGTAMAVGPAGGPCYRCLFEDIPPGRADSCAEAGVVGPMVGVVGALLADLALARLRGQARDGTLVRFDGRCLTTRTTVVAGRASCALCGSDRRILGIEAQRYTEPSCV